MLPNRGSLVAVFVTFITLVGLAGTRPARQARLAKTPDQAAPKDRNKPALEETPIGAKAQPRIPRLTPARPPAADSGSVEELARLLVAAENPLLLGGQAIRTEAGFKRFETTPLSGPCSVAIAYK